MKRFQWALAMVFLALCLKAVAAGDGGADAKKELKALEGDWQLVLQEERGFATPKVVVARLRVVIEGDQMSWYIGNPAANQTANLTVDPTKNPKTIDAAITRGSANGRKMLGIYKLGKDTLEICWAEPGSDKRPQKFTSRPSVGSGNNRCIYRREQEAGKPAADTQRPVPPARKEAFDPGGIRKLQATLPAGWKNDGTILDVRRFVKDGNQRLSVFAILHRGP